MGHRRTGLRGPAAVALLVVLVVTAGCLGGLVGTGDDGSADPTTRGPGDETSTAVDPPAAVAPPFDPDAIRETHRERLQAAGSVTVRRENEIRSVAGEVGRDTTTLARVELDSGTALVRQASTGGERTTYRSPDGTSYRRQVTDDGRVRILPPGAVPPPNVTELVAPSILAFANGSDLTYAGRGQRGGVEGYVYEAEGAAAASPSVLSSLNATREDVHAYELVVVLSADGLVTYGSASLNLSAENRTVLVDRRVRFSAVGETDVVEPGWVRRARGSVHRVGPVSRARDAGP